MFGGGLLVNTDLRYRFSAQGKSQAEATVHTYPSSELLEVKYSI